MSDLQKARELDQLRDQKLLNELLQQHTRRLSDIDALEPAATRQTSIVQAVFESLRARLQDVANIAQILLVAAPPIAHHFGIKLLG